MRRDDFGLNKFLPSFLFVVGLAISRCLSTTPHPIWGQGGSTLLVPYSLIVLKPAILIIMAVVRYNCPFLTLRGYFHQIGTSSERLVKPRANVVNKFKCSIAMLCLDDAHSLEVESHVTIFNQSECFISMWQLYTMLKFRSW